MNQSAFIVGALLAAFVLFLAARGRLPLYASILWGPAPGGAGSGSASGSGSGSGATEGEKGIKDIFEGFDFRVDQWAPRTVAAMQKAFGG